MRILMLIAIFMILSVLVAQIDALLYKTDLWNELKTLLRIDPGSNKWMVYAFLLIGFIYSIVNGVKEKLQKLKKIGSFE
ncbi:hypothetical protein KDJ21_002800 [Metabacillus litoralis]|uniref:hypothetical protein n=1 Tax=Metabacillus litoralis TaxID=152268 RepID=UPI001B93D519|nr:hypothetical protein [Metabacillus litoralis]UHA60679.1 hypothetical protein KDJ21_002800 [Metabacillus litoralis]